jgi:hypothetical protein
LTTNRIALIAVPEKPLANWLCDQYLLRGYVVFRATTELECRKRISRYVPHAIALSDSLRCGSALRFFSELRSIAPSIVENSAIISDLPSMQLASRYGVQLEQCLHRKALLHGLNPGDSQSGKTL